MIVAATIIDMEKVLHSLYRTIHAEEITWWSVNRKCGLQEFESMTSIPLLSFVKLKGAH